MLYRGAETMQEIGVAVVGYGFIGRVHTFAYRNLSFFYSPPPAQIRLMGVCTSRQETAERAMRDGGFEFATANLSDILSRKDVCAVNICTPNRFHADALIAAIRAGKHIYCEKPLTGSWADARRVAGALKGYDGVSQMTLHNRFSPVALRARQLVDQGFLGRVTQFRAAYFHSGSIDPLKPMEWKQDAAAGGGVINDLASHAVDMAEWLAGPLTEVQAESRVLYPKRPDGHGGKVAVEAEDAVVILARLRDGGLGVIEASKIATGSNDELRVEIHGDRGALRFNSMEPNYLETYSPADPEEPIGGLRGWRRIDTVNRLPKPAGWPGPKFTVGWLQTHVHCLCNFVSAVAEGQQTRPSLADGVRLQYMLEAISRSAKERAWQSIPEKTPC
jgi:predicted dehydrogenase